GPSNSLGDDPLYRSTRHAAGMPKNVAAFAYGDLENGLPYVLRLAAQSGGNVPPEAFANTKPLHGAVVYLIKDGDALRMPGFVTSKWPGPPCRASSCSPRNRSPRAIRTRSPTRSPTRFSTRFSPTTRPAAWPARR